MSLLLRLLARARDDGLLVSIAGIYGTGILLHLPSQLSQDGWLALVAGREVARHGLPGTDYLTFWTSGDRWVDQQWLGQLVLYRLAAAGGVELALLAHAALVVGAFALALMAARRLGGSTRAVAWTAVFCLVPIAQLSTNMRPQSFGYVLFVLLLWLLIADSRAPSRRVWLALPMLVVWANLHGSVVLGAVLVALRGVAVGFEGLAGGFGADRRWKVRSGGVLVVTPALCVIASPYGLSLFGYYWRTLHNPDFGRVVTEWQATKLSLLNIPVYTVALASVWLMARDRRLLTAFERLALMFTMIGAFVAERNVGWFGLTAVVVLPRLLDELLARRATVGRPGLNALLGLVGVLAVLVGLSVSLREGRFERHFPARGADAVAAAAARDPSARVFANVRYADWLLWKEPQLRGRMAYDARFELLSHAQLLGVYNWTNEFGEHWQDAARGNRIIVLNLDEERLTEQVLLQEPGIRRIYRDSRLAVFVRSS